MATEVERAWLAGLWDGEGSVGITMSHKTTLRPAVQLSMTHLCTIERARDILQSLGIRGLGYSYREAKAHQKDAHYLRVNRMNEQLIMANALVEYAVTKYDHWVALIGFLERRLDGVPLDAQGRLPRGGTGQWWHAYTPADYEAAEILRALNRRRTPEEITSAEAAAHAARR